jgi:mono/diheme cytochrome c family protein
MMKKILKWIGILLAALVGLVILVAVGLSIAGGMRLNKTHEIQAEAITIPAEEAARERGEHLVNVACKSCHGPDLSGQPLLEDPAIGTVYSANITGLSQTHTDADLVRAIRHAVGTDGRQLAIMPAEAFIHFSAEDLGAVIAYLKTVPPINHDVPTPQLTFMGRILLAAGMFGDIFPAEYIDHNQPFSTMPTIGANVAYGEYLSRFCQSCHGANLAGGQPADPESPPAPNLTPGGRVALYSEDSFIQTMRTGVTPYNYQLDPAFMPWESFGKFDDDELKGLWMYLSSLPALEATAE